VNPYEEYVVCREDCMNIGFDTRVMYLQDGTEVEIKGWYCERCGRLVSPTTEVKETGVKLDHG
jgi:hypothetical protein